MIKLKLPQWKFTSLSARLAGWLLVLVLVPMLLFGYLAYTESVMIVKQEVMNGLVGIADGKARQIEDYLRERRNDIITLARTPTVVNASQELDNCLTKFGAGSSEYTAIENTFRSFISYYSETLGYGRLFVISRRGDIVFTEERMSDFGTNLRSGPFKGSSLAKTVDRAEMLLAAETSVFAYYPPSGKQVAFLATPIMNDGQLIGSLAIEISNDEICHIVQNYEGLGRTGETLIATRRNNGLLSDALFVTPLRHDFDAAFKRRVEISSELRLPIERAVLGRRGTGIAVDYRDHEILAVWRYLPTMELGMVVKIDASEAFAPVTVLTRQMLSSGIMLVFIALGIGLLVSRSVAKPIVKLAEATKNLAAGNLDTRVVVDSDDEVGQLTHSFNLMASDLQHAFATRDNEVNQHKLTAKRMLENEEKFRTLFESSIDAVLLLDETGYFDCNEAAITLFGFTSKAALCTKHPTELSPEKQPNGLDSKSQAEQRIVAAMRDGYCRFEWTHCRSDGTEFPAEVLLSVFHMGSRALLQAVVHDITNRRNNEEELESLNKRLIDAARKSGKAEIATNVLHNVGNVLNTVNVSAGIVQERVFKRNTTNIVKAADLLQKNLDKIGTYITQDEKGKHLPRFFVEMGRSMVEEDKILQGELETLINNIHHIKTIVSAQQSDAVASNAIENVRLASILEEAIQINAASITQHSIQIVRDYDFRLSALVDRSQLLNILVNLISNAVNACGDAETNDKQIVITVQLTKDGNISVSFQDNGVGIPKDNLTRIFAHGYTTRDDGHGFGLHSAALSARFLGGDLTADSEGPGSGATFTLKLPWTASEAEKPSAFMAETY